MCAAYGAKDSGDARKALNPLLEAVNVARGSGSNVVAETHVQGARERVQTDQVVEGVQKLLAAWKARVVRAHTPPRARRHSSSDARSRRDVPVRGSLGELAQLGIPGVTEHNRGKTVGNTTSTSPNSQCRQLGVGRRRCWSRHKSSLRLWCWW